MNRGNGNRNPQPPPTLEEVARLAGVGRGTASRALNGASLVSEATVGRVLRAAERLGYRRNELARSLKVRHSSVVGIVMPDIGGRFMAGIIRAAQDVFRENGYMSVLAFTDGDPDNEAKEIDYLLGRQIDALLVVPAYTRTDHFQDPSVRSLPIVSFDQPIRSLNFDAVLVRNKVGAHAAVRHLIDHGHTDIGCIGVNSHLYSIQQRIDGYRQAIREHNLKESVRVFPQEETVLKSELVSWMGSSARPTALFCLNDFTSLVVLKTLATLGTRVPDQLAIIGFDDVEMGDLLATPLTAVLQPAARIGSESASLLIERIKTPLSGHRDRIMLDVDLVIRNSCGCR